MRKLRPKEAGQLAQVMQLLGLVLGPWGVSSFIWGRVLTHLGAYPHPPGGVSSPTWGRANLSLLTLPSRLAVGQDSEATSGECMGNCPGGA